MTDKELIRIVPLEGCITSAVMLRITDARGTPAIETLAFYG